MFVKAMKNVVVYGLILALGLGIGYASPRVKRMLTPSYSEGDFTAYYPDAKTRVVVYGTATCPYCIKARAYLNERHVAFGDFDLSTSEKVRTDFAKLGGTKVPVILIGNRRLVGFDKDAIDAALAKLGGAAL